MKKETDLELVILNHFLNNNFNKRFTEIYSHNTYLDNIMINENDIFDDIIDFKNHIEYYNFDNSNKYYSKIGFDTLHLTYDLKTQELNKSNFHHKEFSFNQKLEIDRITEKNISDEEKQILLKYIYENKPIYYEEKGILLSVKKLANNYHLFINVSSKFKNVKDNNYGLIHDLKEIKSDIEKVLFNVFNISFDLNEFKVKRFDIAKDVETKAKFESLYNFIGKIRLSRKGKTEIGNLNPETFYYSLNNKTITIYNKTKELYEKHRKKYDRNILRIEIRNIHSENSNLFGYILNNQNFLFDSFKKELENIYKLNKSLIFKNKRNVFSAISNMDYRKREKIMSLAYIVEMGIDKYVNSFPTNARSKRKKDLERDLHKYREYFQYNNKIKDDIERIFIH